MDEFLDKLQEDQRRMRKYLRTHGLRFRKMGELLARPRLDGTRVFVIGEPPLDLMARIIAHEYLTHLPAIPIDLSAERPASVDPDADESPAFGREAAARHVLRHLHPGDLVLALLHDGQDRETRRVLEGARARRIRVLVVGGLDAKSLDTKRIAKVILALPTRGIKTICESIFICARILARVSRATCKDKGSGDERLVQLSCETCTETVFFEERLRGKQAACPLCEAELKIPRGPSPRRESVQVQAEDAEEVSFEPETRVPGAIDPDADEISEGSRKRRGRKRRLKPSVLEVATFDSAELESGSEPQADEISSKSKGKSKGSKSKGRSKTSSKPKTNSRPKTSSKPKSSSKSSSRSKTFESTRSEPTLGPHESLEAPVGLVSEVEGEPAGPSFGSEIVVGSEVASISDAGPALIETRSADPFALDDAFLADLEMPPPEGTSSDLGLNDSEPGGPRRCVSARFSREDCRVRWGRGGFPDEDSPAHGLIRLDTEQVEFVVNPDDEAATTLAVGDELWLRIEIPAFLEPVLLRASMHTITGISGSGGRGTRAELEFLQVDPDQARKLERAAERLGGGALSSLEGHSLD